MTHMTRRSLVCLLLLSCIGTSACSGSGVTAGTATVQSAGPTIAGTGFNQARGFDGPVEHVAPAPDDSGDVFVSGRFTTYGQQSVGPLVRVRPDGTVQSSFRPTALMNKRIVGFAVNDDGRTLSVAELAQDGGTFVARIWRLLPDGSIDGSFATGVATAPGIADPTK